MLSFLLFLLNPFFSLFSFFSLFLFSLVRPVMVWYHGGGMIIGSLEGDHGIAMKYANLTDFVIVNVEYRLAPENVFPRPLHDAYEAFLWVEKNIEKYGGNPSQLFIGGESAGGYLATAITSRYIDDYLVRERKNPGFAEQCGEAAGHNQEGELSAVCKENPISKKLNLIGLIDVYPGLNATSKSEEAMLYAKSSGILPIEEPEWMRSLYQGSPIPDFQIRKHYWFSPGYTPSEFLSYYPATLFIFAKYDVLTAEGIEFYHRLKKESRSPVEMTLYNSTIHSFFGRASTPSGHIALKETSDFMLKIARESQ
jgi:acetyl esterase/lipase